MAVARDLHAASEKAKGHAIPKRRNMIAVIGDGSMSAGMAYEAMNNAGALHSRLIVILNDNDMSIAPPVGAMSAYLARLASGGAYRGLRETAKQLGKLLPKGIYQRAAQAEEFARGLIVGSGTMFEEMGFHYVGPVDGHNLDHLLPVLKNVRDSEQGPILLHVVTQKGKGYAPAEASADRYHGVVKFDVLSGVQTKAKANAPAYTRVFGESLIKAADADDKVVAITAAMPGGTGIDLFGKAHPDRTFDVGIAEQHAVTFAAGLATEGYKPFVAIYSTFLQRAYDQVIHDVALQNLPVRFALDRAGLVGADGATHAGAFDLAYLCCLPNMTVMAAADEAELVHMVATCHAHDTGPIALRYPRGEGVGVEMPEVGRSAADRARADRDAAGECPRGAALARHPARRGLEGGRDAGGGRHRHHRGGCALRQAAGRGADPRSGRQPRGADHPRGRLARRLRSPGAAPAHRTRRPRRHAAAGAHHDPARRLPGPRQPGQDVRRGRAGCRQHRPEGRGDPAGAQVAPEQRGQRRAPAAVTHPPVTALGLRRSGLHRRSVADRRDGG